jgi:hypothetical protein
MAEIEAAPRDLFTVEQFSDRRPAWSKASLRNLILNGEDRLDSRGRRIPGNGLCEAGAIVRLGRRVLIDEGRFFEWIAAQQQQSGSERRTREPKPATRTTSKPERRVLP